MYTILHNSRCGKSREAIKVLEEAGVEFHIREYLKDELTFNELKNIINLLGVQPLDIVRTTEAIWKNEFKDQTYTEEEIIQLMLKHPQLIQRPIVFNDNSGVIGRPVENVMDFIKS